jgi:hypothetical protein
MLHYSKHHIHPKCALLKWDYWVAIMLPVDQVKRFPLLREKAYSLKGSFLPQSLLALPTPQSR